MTQNLVKGAAPGILGLEPYSPGMPIEELQRRLGVSNAIKLASNENPLGMSAKVKVALADMIAKQNLAFYPDGGGHRLKQKLAQMHNITPECITLGNGSNDILEFLARTYAGPGRAVMFSAYAFAVYALAAQAQTAESVVVPARPADDAMPYGHDMAAFTRALRERPDVSLVFIANPNNPTGTWLPPAEIEAFLETVPPHVIVALDEAYFEYQEPSLRPETRRWLDRFPNLLVARTFSKVYGLAGLRVGYALSNPTVADLLNRVRQPFNNNSLALLAAEVALDDQAHVEASVALNTRERARLIDAMKQRGLSVLPTQANFITINFNRDANPIHQGLLERGVIVRPMGSYQMPTYLRVTVGTTGENDRFLAALDEALKA
ncbi:MAG: histidinol-phosphate transaminase [Pseudomonadota bacterium]|nr:histidinol-phosphate transaminase [Pseudomonadota bacterium]